MALAADTTTQTGMSNVFASRLPFATRARAMIPIVFWASLVPCDSENSDPETICPIRYPRLTMPGLRRPTIR